MARIRHWPLFYADKIPTQLGAGFDFGEVRLMILSCRGPAYRDNAPGVESKTTLVDATRRACGHDDARKERGSSRNFGKPEGHKPESPAVQALGRWVAIKDVKAQRAVTRSNGPLGL